MHASVRHRRYSALAAVLVASVALAGCFGAGIRSVGSPLTSVQMPPGLWRSLGGSGCTWTRVRNGTPAVAGTNVRTNGPQYMQLEASDRGVAIGNCLPFWQQPGAFARPVVQPGNPFGDGDFLVGYEVAPGTYAASAPRGQRCTWAVVKGFHGNDASGHNPDFVRGDTTTAGSPTAVIDAGNYGFTSQGCGQWHLTSPLPAAPGGASASGLQIGGIVEDFPDPTVLRVDDADTCGGTAPCYYAYSTEAGFLGLLNVPVARSTDLSTWDWAGTPVATTVAAPPEPTPTRDAMPELASWVQFGGNWAPSVIARPSNPPDERFVMYYTAKSKTSGKECVGIATSASPGGPFVDPSSAPKLCNTAAGGTIDPSAYVAGDGSLTLSYADDVGIKAQRLSADGLSLAGGEQLLMHFDSGYSWELPRIEGPSMFNTPSGLVLLYSAGTFSTSTYSVGAAACDTPLGPCYHIYSTPSLSSRGSMLGPGGQTPFQLGNGSWMLAFHAWTNVVGYPAGKRSLHVLPITFPGGKPAIG